MPLVRIVALAALVLTFALAVVLIFALDGDAGQLTLLLIAAANAALVMILARARPGQLAGAALWLIVAGVAAILAAATSPYWIERMLPRGDSLEGILARFDMGLSAFLVPFWIGGLALALGWVLWIASRIAARRRAARVASEPRLPI
ncbi:MAG: hypothetical protein ABW023_07760 [Sphingomonas sp.]